ncbi:conserved hypothetical protein [uncultured Dysgonomonas sp.]|uniref:DUF4129 domain-containing protein n=1 Tax=uncultured Dysgonomonas sp. TaxID=206096 RepID=A0A212IWX8_9BACT|nr:hypothetical protein [uncultured Dysgonomonas sp.]SBV91677.1 conserved hypothetical protein [uncultured Dysgonomonas sp.]
MCINLFGQVDSTATPKPAHIQEKVNIRIPDKSKIEEYRKDQRFEYKKEERGLSWWNRILLAINNFINNLLGTVAESGMLSIVVLIIIVVVICLIVLKLIGVDYRILLGKKELDKSDIDIYTENVHEMNFDALISNALRNKDYRLAVRFLYLKNLKQMSDKDIIEWSAHKTNYSYQYEIQNSLLRSKFLETTLIFDYVWYGEFELDENKFTEVDSRMGDLNKMINHER